jgi:alpha-D-ribose 1-methylphosphonate 5-triphosphate synthase subunit PhnG
MDQPGWTATGDRSTDGHATVAGTDRRGADRADQRGRPDDAERKAIMGITGVHQPAGTKRLTVSLAALDAAVLRGTGYGLVPLLTELGGPLRNWPGAAASLAASRAE